MKPDDGPTADEAPLAARARIGIGSFSFEGEARATAKGVLAVGGLVSMILLSVAPILLSVAVIKRAKRALPAPRGDDN